MNGFGWLDVFFCCSPLLGGWVVHIFATRVLAKKAWYN